MTTPRERFRALRWARAWLEGVTADPMVPPHAKAEAGALLQAYPSDELLREAINNKSAPEDSLLALGEASHWMFAFRHPTSNPDALRWALRHMPTPADVEIQVLMQKHRSLLADQCLNFADWLDPDEDYVRAFVVGSHEDCAIAAGMEWLGASEDEIESASPMYLITASTFGIDYKSLKLRQPVLCTVPRSSINSDPRWKYVDSCVAPRDVPLD